MVSSRLIIELSEDVSCLVWYRSFFQPVFHAKAWHPGELPNVSRHQYQIQSEMLVLAVAGKMDSRRLNTSPEGFLIKIDKPLNCCQILNIFMLDK
jgi:hypothetical protein